MVLSLSLSDWKLVPKADTEALVFWREIQIFQLTVGEMDRVGYSNSNGNGNGNGQKISYYRID